jgi:hypothetical protein
MLYVKAFGGKGGKKMKCSLLSLYSCPVAFQEIGDGVGYEAKRKLLFLVGMEFSY